MAFKILPIFGRNKEEETINSLKKLMGQVELANKAFQDCTKYWLDDDYENLMDKVKELQKYEKETDSINRKLNLKLFSGAFFPGSRSSIHELSEDINSIVDGIFHSSTMFLYMEDKKFKEDVKGKFWKLIGTAKKSVDLLIVVINDLLDNNSGLKNHIKQISKLKDECESIKSEIEELVYFGKKEVITNTLLIKIAELVYGISDSADEASQKVEVLKIIRG